MKDLSMHIMDIIQNSVRAEALLVKLIIEEQPKIDLYAITITDNGKGMNKEVLSKVTDPFFTTRTTRKVGLGLALLKQNAEQAGGGLYIDSEEEKGTILKVTFSHKSIDRPKLGDISGTMVLLVAANPNMDFRYEHITEKGSYVFDTKEVKAVLENVSISDANIVGYLKEMINENLNEII